MYIWNIFVKLLHEGGWVLYPIFGVTAFAWYLGFGKLFTCLSIGSARKNFNKILKSHISGKTCGFPRYDRLFERLSVTSDVKLKRLAFREFISQTIYELNSGITTLSSCAVITPLLGLLGTIIGMSEMFSVIGEFGFGSPSIMAHGISIALQATLTGLGAAVVILFFQDFLITRKNKLLDAIKEDYKNLYGEASGYKNDEAPEKGKIMQPDFRLVHDDNERPDINLAPFVDTIMILLIFFVVTANLYVETGVDVSRPKASTAKSVGSKAILIGVTREGSIHMFGRQISIDRLRSVLEIEAAKQPDVSVVIIADKETVVGRAVEVMDQCALAGVQKVSVAAGKE